MSLITLFLVLIVAGVLLWLVTTYIPMDTTFKRLIVAVAVIVAVLWILQSFGVLSSINSVHVGRVHG